jgi:NADP-dependent 3-hydroxy acid dehydrogenase YdfG
MLLALLGRDRHALHAAADQLDAGYAVADVTKPEMLAVALAELGPCDILVNNAGAASSQPFLKSTPQACST